jgi:thiamine pyrophosphate-dependent acetolactate synthase large subunit-like protein
VLTTMPGKSAFPENHQLSLRSAVTKPEHLMQFLTAADCVFGIGTSLRERCTARTPGKNS